MSAKPEISFIGLGAMGFGMAANLVKEGYPVTGFDLWPPTLERFAAAGGKTATTPAEAVAGKPFCVCMVATAQQAHSVLLGDAGSDLSAAAIEALPTGATILLCSTVPCAYVQKLEKQIKQRGRDDVLLVDAPVSGGALRAAAGTLSIMAGASDAAIIKSREVLQTMSDPAKLYIVQGGIGAGSNMKMVHQVLAANQILSSSEALGFAARLGLDLDTVASEIVASDGWSWMLENRLPRILDANHLPIASAITIILKDTSIITTEARRVDYPTPMTSAAEQVYFASLSRGYGADDDASLIRLYKEGADGVQKLIVPASTGEKSDETKKALVISLLKGIHLCAAAEALAFAAHVGLDLDQVFELCINAAGGSKMLSQIGPDIIKILRGQAVESSSIPALSVFAKELHAAVDEAQRLKVPVFLGNAAMSLIRVALRTAGASSGTASASNVVSVWTA